MNGNDETKKNRASMLLLAKEGASNFRILSMVTKKSFFRVMLGAMFAK
jgi:hypothetical protein